MTRRPYFICTVNRTGSAWLCWMLRSTGVCGQPYEFDPDRPVVEQWKENENTDPYGVKLNALQLRTIWPHVSRPDKHNARWVHLVRDDMWRQAISLVRAQQSGIWHVERDDGEIPAEHRETEYDAWRIIRERRRLMRGRRDIRLFLHRHHYRPLRIVYEEMCEAPEATVRHVLEHLGFAYDGPIDTDGMRRQADDITEDWLRRLRADGHIKTQEPKL